MKKASTLLVMAIIVSCQLSYSQVKRQYQDELFAETTIVIKENAETNDLDLLNSNYDLDDVSVGQVFRLTTEQVSSKSPTVKIQREKPVVLAAVAAPAPEIAVVQEVKPPQQSNVSGAPAEVPQRVTRSTGGMYPVKAYSYMGNFAKKKIKKKNKKKRKRKGNKCYKF